MTQPVSSFDINRLCQEALIRWLKPKEVLYILKNHESLDVRYKTPQKPPSGSIFLFNRRVHRNFRNDGHSWRKKRNGRSVREGHERLKVGSLEVLNCYYAHGEQNDRFQRRCYWMLDPAFDHIAFVHYREVNEGRCIPESILTGSDGSNQTLRCIPSTSSVHMQNISSQIGRSNEADENSFSPASLEEVNSEFERARIEIFGRINASDTSNQSPLQESLRRIEMHLISDEDDSKALTEGTNPLFYIQSEESQNFQHLNYETRDSSQERLNSVSNGHMANGHAEETGPEYSHMLRSTDVLQLHLNSPALMDHFTETDICGASSFPLETDNNVFLAGNGVSSASLFSDTWHEPSQFEASLKNDLSFTVSKEQWFDIREVSPEWAFSSESTKVIITGHFSCNPSVYQWSILFGDLEVPAEIVQDGVLRCLTPQDIAGKVKLCIISGERNPCSQEREFEFRPKLSASTSVASLLHADAIKSKDEILLLIKLVHAILSVASTDSRGGHQRPEFVPLIESKETEDVFAQLTVKLLSDKVSQSKAVDLLLQELIKDKLRQLLSSKSQNHERDICILSKQEQCIVHLISGLGYDWALNLALDLGIAVNFRDPNGWTALHWAAYYGREHMVIALLKAGVSAEAKTDPSAEDPAGKTAADLASANGHKGLAAYLSEAALASQYFSFTTLKKGKLRHLASLEGFEGVENIMQRSAQLDDGTEEQLTLRDSLSAVRNAAQAAARIQSVFRAYSFRKNQQKTTRSHCEYGMPLEEAYELSAVTKSHRNDQKVNIAATSIQKNYRCWRKRKEFLIMRKHVVNIQTHVRTHLARKKYKELLRAVSVMEKIIMRWHKRGVGLRGFQPPQDHMHDDEDNDIRADFRKQKVDIALNVALSRVKSIIGHPEARQQYRRLLENSQDQTQSRSEEGLRHNSHIKIG